MAEPLGIKAGLDVEDIISSITKANELLAKCGVNFTKTADEATKKLKEIAEASDKDAITKLKEISTVTKQTKEDVDKAIASIDTSKASSQLKELKADLDSIDKTLALNAEDAKKLEERLNKAESAYNRSKAALDAYDERVKNGQATFDPLQRGQYLAGMERAAERLAAVRKEASDLHDATEQLKNDQKATADQIAAATAKADEEAAALKGLNAESKNLTDEAKKRDSTANRYSSPQKALRQLRQEISQLADEYGRLTEAERNSQKGDDILQEIDDKRVQASQLYKIVTATNAQLKHMSSKNLGFEAIAQGANLATSGLSTMEGVLTMLGVSEKSLMEVQTAIQTSLAANNFLTQASVALRKSSSLMIGIETVQHWANEKAIEAETAAKTANGIATSLLSAKQAVFNRIAKANPYVLLALAILSVVGAVYTLVKAYNAHNKAAEEAKKKQEEMKQMADDWAKSVGSTAAKQLVSYQKLRQEWEKLGDSQTKKSKFIDDNKKKFNELGFAVDSVRGAENFFVKNTDNVVAAIMARAEATAYENLMVSAMQKKIEAQAKAQQEYDTAKQYTVGQVISDTKGLVAGRDYTVDTISSANGQFGGTYNSPVYRLTTSGASERHKELVKQLDDANSKAESEYNETVKIFQSGLKKSQGKLEAAYSILEDAGIKQYSDGASKSAKDSSQKELEERLKKRQQLIQKLASLEQEGQELELKYMKDGDEKRRKQIELDYNKQIETVRQKEKELLDLASSEQSRNALTQQFGYGTVDVLARPYVSGGDVREAGWQNAGNGNASLYATTKSVKDMQGNSISILVTPVLPDGTVLTQAELSGYINSTLNGASDILAADSKGIVIKINPDKDDEKRLLELQDAYYNVAANVQQTISSLYRNAAAERQQSLKKLTDDELKAQADAMDEYLAQYGTYQQQREAVARQYAVKIREAETEGEKLTLQKQMNDALKDLDFEQLKRSLNLSDVFGDLDRQTTESLRSIQQKLREYIDTAKGLRPDEVKDLQEAYDEIYDELGSRNPFKILKTSMQSYSDAQAQVKKAQEELNTVMNGGQIITGIDVDANGKLHARLLTVEEAEKNLAKAQENLNKVIQQFATDLGETGRKLSEYAQAAAQISSVLNDSFGIDIGDNMNKAIEGVDQLGSGISTFATSYASGNVLGMVSGGVQAIGGAVKAATGIIDNFWGADWSQYNRMVEKYEQLNKVWAELIDSKREYLSMSYGTEALQIGEETEALQQQAIESNRILGRQLLNSGAGIGSHSIGVRQRKKMITSEGWAQLRTASNSIGFDYDSVASGRMLGLFDLTSEQLQKLKEQAPVFWANLDDQVEEYLNNIIDGSKTLEEIQEEVAKQVTGTTFDDVSSGFWDMISDMEAGTQDFADDVNKMLFNAFINSKLKTKYNKQLQDWYDTLSKYSEDGLDENEIKELQDQYKEISEAALKERNDAAKITGYGSATNADQQATYNSLDKFTYEQADDVISRMTALQILNEHQYERLHSITEGQLRLVDEVTLANDNIRSIEANVRTITDIQRQSLSQLERINENTQPISRINANTQPIQSIADELIRLRKIVENQ